MWQLLLVGLALLAAGAGLIYLGIYIIWMGSEDYRNDQTALLWNMITAAVGHPANGSLFVGGASILLGVSCVMAGLFLVVAVTWAALTANDAWWAAFVRTLPGFGTMP